MLDLLVLTYCILVMALDFLGIAYSGFAAFAQVPFDPKLVMFLLLVNVVSWVIGWADQELDNVEIEQEIDRRIADLSVPGYF